jgi:hypothetical protein
MTSIWTIYALLNILLQWRISSAFKRGFVDRHKEEMFSEMKKRYQHTKWWNEEDIMKKCESPSYLRIAIGIYANLWMLPIAILLSCMVIWFG